MTEDRLQLRGGSTRRLMLGVGALAALAGAGVAWRRFQETPVLPQAVQDWWGRSFDLPQGGALQVSRYKGRPLLLNFWATWCPPCVEELPMLDAFWREHASKGVQILGLAVDQPSAVRRFLEKSPLGFPVALAGLGGTELTRAMGNSAGGLPFTVFFADDGSIWRQKLGQLKPSDLEAWAQYLR
jgi:thiol-disulfide isomerase/thioredoxin